MSKKTPKPTAKPRTLSKKAIILITIPLLLFVILPLSIFAYIKLLDYQDAQKFQSLKADMLALQTEFNKIMPGWEYEEGCWGGGGPYNVREPQGCRLYISLDNYDFDLKKQQDFLTAVDVVKRFRLESEREYEYKGLPYVAWRYRYNVGGVGCLLTSDRASDKYSTGIEMICSGVARSFHFPQIN